MCVCVCTRALVTQSCPTLWDPIDCSPQSSSVPGILQAGTLQWVSIPFFRESSHPRDWTWVSCIEGRLRTIWATREALNSLWYNLSSPMSRLSQNTFSWGFPGGSDCKESACNAGDLGSIPGLGRYPGEGNVNPLQYSCLENLMDRGTWRDAVYCIANSQTQLSN